VFAASLDIFVHVLATHDKLKVAAFAQLTVVGRGINACIHVSDFYNV